MIAFCMWFFFHVVVHIGVTELVLRLFKSMEIDKRPEEKFRQGFTGTPAAAGGNKTSKFPLFTA